jgi:hypothetical protein
MKHATALALLAIVLIGCVTSPTPVPPTQTPWIVTATPIPPQSISRIGTATPVAAATAIVPTSISSEPETISWSDAGNYVNQSKTVCGPVLRATFSQTTNGQPTYLDLGRAYPDPTRFSILIWGNQRANFSAEPENLYRGKTICATGKIASYRGTLEMEVRTATQIQVK